MRAVPEHDAPVGGGARALVFEDFVEEENARLFRALYLVTGSRHESEEVMQDAFLALWERWERVGTLEDPTGYLYRTAMNLWRKRRRRAGLALRRTLQLAPTEDPFAVVEDRDAVFRSLKQLHPNQRAAIVATSLLGFSSDEAASLLGMSPAVVRMHASRGRAQMKIAMEDPR